MRYSITLFVLLFTGLVGCSAHQPPSSVSSPFSTHNKVLTTFHKPTCEHTTPLAKEINAYRQQNNRAPLKLHSALQQAAQSHGEDLAQRQQLSHTGSQTRTIRERLQKAGYTRRGGIVAENLGRHQKTPQQLVSGWHRSPPHKRNLLLKEANHLGTGCAPDKNGKIYWVAVFAR